MLTTFWLRQKACDGTIGLRLGDPRHLAGSRGALSLANRLTCGLIGYVEPKTARQEEGGNVKFMSLLRRASLPRFVSTAILGTSLVVLAGVVGVADTGSNTAYNGCINVATVVLRTLPNQLAAPFNDCVLAGNPILTTAPKLLEVRSSWNQSGPTGLQGQKGAIQESA